MSERFVEGFAFAPAKLAALLGTPAVGFAAIHKLIGSKPIFEDLVMTIGDGDDDEAGGIAVLQKWVTMALEPSPSKRKAVAAKGNALLLVLDGDQ